MSIRTTTNVDRMLKDTQGTVTVADITVVHSYVNITVAFEVLTENFLAAMPPGVIF